jgi:Xaa-Pro aminopeptidase
MAAAEIQRACEQLRSIGADFALLTSIPNVTYLSGWEVPIEVGPVAEFTGWLPFGFVLLSVRDASGCLLVPEALGKPAANSNRLERIVTFSEFGHFEAVDTETNFINAIRQILRDAGLSSGGRLAIEPRTLPALVLQLLQREMGAVELQDATPSLEAARSIKTPREIELIRQAIAVADAGQQALLTCSHSSGVSDLEVWDEITGGMERSLGRPLVASGELVTGERTRTVAPGGPISRRVERGDTGLLDISPRVNGYWADCTNTVVFDAEPTPDQRRYFHAARDAMEAGAEALRPGARARDVEEAVRVAFAKHHLPVAHYSGHQIGTSVNERPRLVQYDDSIIEPNMVFAVEPGAYGGETAPTGARAEKVVLVTETGPEILSSFEWGM